MLRRNATCFAIMLLLTCSCPILADRFDDYLLHDVFELPDIKGLPAGVAVFDVSPASGRLVAVIDADVYLETGVHSSEFVLLGGLPGADIPFYGPAFVRVSPDGNTIAVGNNGGETFTNFEVGVFALNDLSGAWFSAFNYDGVWSDNTTLILTGGEINNPSIVTALDTTSDPAAPTNPTVIGNVGGASGGIALDAEGNLYTGNGFAGDGPSETGTIKFFDQVSWSAALTSGVPLDFEADGIVVADVLSAASLGFDLEGNLHVGGGDGGGDADYAALVRSSAIQDAIAGFGPADSNDPEEVRKLDPEPFFDFNFFDVRANTLTGRLYVREDLTIYVYASPFGSRALSFDPAPGQLVNNPSFNDPARALGAPVGGGTSAANNTSIVSLGGFGGSITIAFDHTVLDDPANPMGLDAVVFGNAFWVVGDPNRHWAECGHLEISRDDNRNGLADDAWFLIPGSHITDLKLQYTSQTWDDDTDDPRYPPSDPDWIPPGQPPGPWTTEAYLLLPPEIFNAPVIDNPNGPDAVEEGVFGYADFSPTLSLGDTDADDIVDDFEIPSSAFYVVPDDPMEVGITPGSGGGDAFDIAWAIDDETGEPADLDGFDFIRITTAVNFIAGALGEVSPEIDAVADVAPDCNGSGLADWYDIELGDSFDDDADGVPDECACLVYGDVNGDGTNDLDDLSCLLDGLNGIFECPNVVTGELDISPCRGGDGNLNLRDLLSMLDTLAGASPCPSECP